MTSSGKISASFGQQPMKGKEHCFRILSPAVPPPSQVIQASDLNFLILSVHIRKMGIVVPQRAVAGMTKDNTHKTSSIVAVHFGK